MPISVKSGRYNNIIYSLTYCKSFLIFNYEEGAAVNDTAKRKKRCFIMKEKLLALLVVAVMVASAFGAIGLSATKVAAADATDISLYITPSDGGYDFF